MLLLRLNGHEKSVNTVQVHIAYLRIFLGTERSAILIMTSFYLKQLGYKSQIRAKIEAKNVVNI